MTQVSVRRTITLVDIGGRLPDYGVNLDSLARRLNSLQRTFKFVNLAKPVRELSDAGDRRGFTGLELINAMCTYLGNAHAPAIGITYLGINMGGHNFDCHDGHFGLVTIDGYKDYLPIGMRLAQYISYLILCEAFCVSTGKELEHAATRGCLMDKCWPPSVFRADLAEPLLCEVCKANLIREGFTGADLTGAENVLAYVGKRSLAPTLRKALSHPVSAFLVGSLLMNFLISSVQKRLGEGRLGWIALGISIAWIGFLIFRYRCGRRSAEDTN